MNRTPQRPARVDPQRPRVLVLAEQANPTFVSVPLIGWCLSRALAEVADVHLVTQVRNRGAILHAGLVEGRDFTAIDSEKVAARMHRLAGVLRGGKGKGWTTVMAFNAISYRYFERLVWRRFGGAIRAGEYDIVHRVTPLSPTLPSPLAKRCRKAGVPFIWGPINGGVAWPREFDAARRAEREWLSYVRDAYKLLPGYRSTRANLSALLVGSRATLEQVPARYRDKCVYLPENAIDPARFGATGSPRNLPPDHSRGPDFRGAAASPLRLVFLGRLVPYKGADMLIEAAAELIKAGRATLTVLGDGPELPRLKALIAEHGLGGGVSLPGWVAHEQLQHTLVEHDVLAFPSIREFGGGVVLEAMAVGLVPVVVDYAGPAELVTATTGYRVPLGDRAVIVRGLREVLTRIADDPSGLAAMGEAARARVRQHFTWSAKAAQVACVYRAVLAGQPLPDFGMPLPDVATATPRVQEVAI